MKGHDFEVKVKDLERSYKCKNVFLFYDKDSNLVVMGL